MHACISIIYVRIVRTYVAIAIRLLEITPYRYVRTCMHGFGAHYCDFFTSKEDMQYLG